MIEGVDFSATANNDWGALAAALKANGKRFAGRYAVNDKSPNGRGITAEEYQALTSAGVDVFLYWQTTTNWMLDGYAAGAQGAVNAQNNITAEGMPATMPVYFACDFDAIPAQQAVIDDCLRGAASVLGIERVGLYAGYWPLTRAMANKSATWFCQTTAWSGGQIASGVHLYQYDYNQYIAGTNCDWVRAYKDNYGQASKFIAPPGPVYATPEVPEWFAASVQQAHPSDANVDGVRWFVLRRNFEALKNANRYAWPDTRALHSGPKILTRDKIVCERTFKMLDPATGKMRQWIVEPDGSYVTAASLTPAVTIRSR